MSNELKNSFDASIRSALQDHQVAYDDSTWSTLEEKMQMADAAADIAMEEAAKRALRDYQVPYNHSTWHILNERLEKINYRNRIIATKIFEAAVILFAILTLVKFLGQIPDVTDHLPLPFAKTENITPASDSQMDIGLIATLDQNRAVNKAGQDLLIQNGDQPTVRKQGGLLQSSRSTNPTLDMLPQTRSILKAREVFNRNRTINSIKDHIGDKQFAGRDVERSTGTSVDKLDNREIPSLSVPRDITASGVVAAVPMLPVFDIAMLVAETATDFQIASVEREPKVRTKFNVFYQNNVHRIENVAWRQTSFNQTESSNGFGFATNVQFGRIGFDLGAIFDQVIYDAGFGENEINKIQVPLNLRYSGFHTKYADFYVKSGMSVHGVTRGHYEAPVFQSAAPGPRQTRPHFNDGLLNDGNYEDNTYFSVNAGAGLDIMITKSFSLFAECMYQKRLKGELGLTDDKFNTFSANLGMSYIFK